MFSKKPYEYDVYKKERRRFLFFMLIISIIVAGLFYYNVYVSKNTVYITATQSPDSTTWIDVPYYQPVDAPIKSDRKDRDPVKYYNVIAQFDVENSFRYKRNEEMKFDNIFVWDVTMAMGTILPHYFDENLIKAKMDEFVYVGSANVLAHFLEKKGVEYGWKAVSAAQAQQRANSGYPTIAVWLNPDAGEDEREIAYDSPAGHIMIVRPSPTGVGFKTTKGPYIAQAGDVNTMNLNVSDVLSFFKRRKVLYYTHD